jgi:hypothetical protein
MRDIATLITDFYNSLCMQNVGAQVIDYFITNRTEGSRLVLGSPWSTADLGGLLASWLLPCWLVVCPFLRRLPSLWRSLNIKISAVKPRCWEYPLSNPLIVEHQYRDVCATKLPRTKFQKHQQKGIWPDLRCIYQNYQEQIIKNPQEHLDFMWFRLILPRKLVIDRGFCQFRAVTRMPWAHWAQRCRQIVLGPCLHHPHLCLDPLSMYPYIHIHIQYI